MDAFGIRNKMIDGYRSFSEGFVDIQDPAIARVVEAQSSQGLQWPDPWLSRNPPLKSGGSIGELVSRGLLHDECRRVFRVKNSLDDPGAREPTRHQYQADAVKIDSSCQSYVLKNAEHILETFQIVNRLDQQESGEPLSKRLTLENFDANSKAAATGIAFESPIVPQPGKGERHQIKELA